MTRLAVLGDPIEHSLSPQLHLAAYAALGDPFASWTYERVRVAAGTLAAFIGSRGREWRGFSVTAPLKQEAYELATTRTERAELTQAVNTLVRTDDGWQGDNTDLLGALTAIRERHAGPMRTAAILGGGATAVSTGLALAELGVDTIWVLVREPAKAARTAALIAAHPDRPRVHVDVLSSRWPVDIVVSTVPVAAQDAALVARWADTAVVFDVVYDPWPTPLSAQAAGVVVSGLDLLVHQAVAQVALFTGGTVDASVLREAGERALEARR